MLKTAEVFYLLKAVEGLSLICFQYIAMLKTAKFSLSAKRLLKILLCFRSALDINLLKTSKAMLLICFQYIASLLLMLTNDLGGNISSFKYREKAFLKEGGDLVKVKVIQ